MSALHSQHIDIHGKRCQSCTQTTISVNKTCPINAENQNQNSSGHIKLASMDLRWSQRVSTDNFSDSKLTLL